MSNFIKKVVTGSHHQGDIRYGNTAGIQCSCMSLMALSWTLFKNVAYWNCSDVDTILKNGDNVYKNLNVFRLLDVDELPRQISTIKGDIVNISFLTNKTGEILLRVYLISVEEIVSNSKDFGTGALLTINNYTLALIWGKGCFFLFDSHSKNTKGEIVPNGTAVLLKFDSLKNLEEYLKIYYTERHHQTFKSMYFQIQFVECSCLNNTSQIIKPNRCFKNHSVSSSEIHASSECRIKKHQITEVLKASHHQANARYGETAGIQCACMTLMAICLTIFKDVHVWESYDLDYILEQGDRIFKDLRMFRLLGIDDLPQNFAVEGTPVVVEFLDNRTGEITLNAYLISVTDIVTSCTNIGTGALLIIRDFTLALIWGEQCYFLFDSHSKNDEGEITPNGVAVLLKFQTLGHLEEYIKYVYYSENTETLFFQLQFINCCSINYSQTLLEAILQSSEMDILRTNSLRTKSADETLLEAILRSNEMEILCMNPLTESANKRNIYTKRNTNSKDKHIESSKKQKKNHIDRFLSQIFEGPFFICTICHRCLYRQSVIKFVNSKYGINILSEANVEYVLSFDNLIYICRTCNKGLSNKKLPCQSVSNKLALDEIPIELRSLKRLEKILISRRILFKKIAIMHGKGEFSKIRGSICNIPIEADSLCNILPRPADSTGVIIVKLKRDLRYRGYVYFEPVRVFSLYNALYYLKANNRFYKDIFIRNLPDNEIFNIAEHCIDNENENSQIEAPSWPNTDEYNCNEDPLNKDKVNCNESALISEIPNIVGDENIIVAPGQGKKPLSIFHDEHCEELAFPYLFPKGKYGYKVKRNIPLSPVKYFNQRLLNYKQNFSSCADYIFFARSVVEEHHLRSSMNIALRIIKTGFLKAGSFRNNYKDSVKQHISQDNAFSFMSSVKGTPSYWKQFLLETLAMVKQLGIPTFFLTLSCADLRWQELLHIVNKLNDLGLDDEKILNLSYKERCNLLNENPVLIARHFQYKVQLFFKEILIDGPLGKTKYYALRIEFQERGSPHVHSFLWIFDAPKIDNEEEYIRFVKKTISARLPDSEAEPELFDLVKTYQIHCHSRTCWKKAKNKCRFSYGRFFSDRIIISKPLGPEFTAEERKYILNSRANILKKVKIFIDEKLYPSKVNIIDPKKEHFIEPPTIEQILEELEISANDYYNALSISKDNDYELHLIRPPNSCFVNSYFEDGLRAWKANMDIQPVFNEYKAVTYMCSYFTKSEDQCSQAIKQAAKEAFENKLEKFHVMKTIVNAYISKRECSVQEAVYHILPELQLRRVFPAVLFANTNLPEERCNILLAEDKLNQLPYESTKIFKRTNLDRYIDRPNTSFCQGKFEILDSFCYAEFLAYYTVIYKTKADESDDYEYQPDNLPDTVVEGNHIESNYPKKIKLMNSNEKMQCRKVRRVLRYHVPNKYIHPEKYAHHLLLLFFPFRAEEKLKAGIPASYQNKLLEEGVQEIVYRNKHKFEPFAEIVDEAYANFNAEETGNQEPFEQNSDDETNQGRNNENSSEDSNTLKNDAKIGGYSMPPLLSDDEIGENIRVLNKKQRIIFDIVYEWARDYVKMKSLNRSRNVEPIHLFVSGSGGTGKSHLIKTIYQAVSKTLVYHSENPDKPSVLLLGPTGISAVNIGGTTIHSGLGIKPGPKFMGLSDSMRASLRNKLSEVKLIMIDEVSMVSNDLFRNINRRLQEIFMCSTEVLFGGISIILIGDFLQLPPVKGKPIYAPFGYDDKLDTLFGLELWHTFKFAELTEVMRQKDELEFVQLLNQIRIGNINQVVENKLKSRFIDPTNEIYPSNSVHMFAENQPSDVHNQNILDKLPGDLYEIEATDVIPASCNYPPHVITEAKNRKQTDTGGLAKCLKVKVGASIRITVNIDIQDRLINGQVGKVSGFDINGDGQISKIYVKFEDNNIGMQAMRLNYFTRRNNCVPIEKCEAEIPIRKNTYVPCIKRTQFPLKLAWACTVHKVQGLSLNEGVVSFDLQKQKSFGSGQIYVALSRVRSFERLFCIGQFKKSAIKVNKDALEEYERLKSNSIFDSVQNIDISNDTLSLFLLNVRSLKKHARDLKSDIRIMNNDIVCLTETQMSPESTIPNADSFNAIFDIFMNNNENKFLTLAYALRKQTMVLNEFENLPAVTFLKVNKSSFSECNIKILLLYRQHSQSIQSFCELLGYLIESKDLDIILGDFNIGELRKTERLQNILSQFTQLVKQPTHIGGACLDHIYIKSSFLETYNIETNVFGIYFSGHDGVRIEISKNNIDFERH